MNLFEWLFVENYHTRLVVFTGQCSFFTTIQESKRLLPYWIELSQNIFWIRMLYVMVVITKQWLTGTYQTLCDLVYVVTIRTELEHNGRQFARLQLTFNQFSVILDAKDNQLGQLLRLLATLLWSVDRSTPRLIRLITVQQLHRRHISQPMQCTTNKHRSQNITSSQLYRHFHTFKTKHLKVVFSTSTSHLSRASNCLRADNVHLTNVSIIINYADILCLWMFSAQRTVGFGSNGSIDHHNSGCLLAAYMGCVACFNAVGKDDVNTHMHAAATIYKQILTWSVQAEPVTLHSNSYKSVLTRVQLCFWFQAVSLQWTHSYTLW